MTDADTDETRQTKFEAPVNLVSEVVWVMALWCVALVWIIFVHVYLQACVDPPPPSTSYLS